MSSVTEGESTTQRQRTPRTTESTTKQSAVNRIGVSIVGVAILAGAVILWVVFSGGSKKTSELPSVPPVVMHEEAPLAMPHTPAPYLPAAQTMRKVFERPRNQLLFTTKTERGPAVAVNQQEADFVPLPRTNFPEKLPMTVLPVHYDIMFKIIMDARKFNNYMYGDAYFLGKAIIEIRAVVPTRAIFLHATGFTLKEHQTTLMKTVDKTFIGIGKMSVNDELEMLKIELDSELEPNQTYSLSLEFAGPMHTSARGLYKSYHAINGVSVKIAGTQFEPTYARKAFPCFDEPALKATFDLVIVRPKNYRTFSNMPLTRSEDRAQDFVADYYDRSPAMSTYHLAFVLTPYFTAGMGVVKVQAPSQQLQNAEYALKMAPKLLSFYRETFGLDFPLPKLDLVSMPTLIGPAIENWGIITIQPHYLQYANDETPFTVKVESLKIIAQKIAQQWIGGLVTMNWWDHLWLKEGLSNYFAYRAGSAADPQTDMLPTILVKEVHAAMETDGHNSTRTASRPVNDPVEIRKQYNSLTYTKGVSLCRMMAHLIPTNAFNLGLKEFLRKYSYKAAQPEHLFRELNSVQRQLFGSVVVNYTSVMDRWLTRSGFPVVTLKRSYAERTATISQTRFFFGASTDEGTLWQVPITYVTEENPDFETTTPKMWLRNVEAPVMEMPPKNRWVILNVKEAYLYKVNYDKTNWLLIISQLENDHKVIHENNRAQLIDDCLDFGRAGIIPYDLAFDLLEYLPKERHFLPWTSALANFQRLDPVLRHTKVYPKWKKFVNHLLTNIYDRLMSEEHRDESLQISILRVAILTLTCDYGHEPCVSFCKKMFENLKSNYELSYHMIPYSYRSLVYCQAIKFGNEADFNFLWKHYETAATNQERAVLIKALSCTPDLKLLEKLLLKLINKKSGVETTQRAANLLNAISSTSLSGSSTVVRFMSSHQEAVFGRYGTLQGLFDSILESIVDNIRHESELQKLHDIYERTKDVLPEEEEKVQRMIGNAKEHIHWTTRYYRDVETWLEKRYFSGRQSNYIGFRS
ncbi:aminopeptidase N-like [Ornithodoros turicata]|uniref:aminopeptidase N-like n=1 Tax=Ornithodoros turicata TaxID=34597 RepID=UPI00313A1605